jgi:hypothetical protein
VALTKIPGSLIDTASGINGLIYPSSDGTAGQFLTTDGSGNLSFATVTTYTDSDVETYLDGGTSTPTFATATVSGTLTVTGDLDLTGDINSYNVTDLDITDQTITLGAGQTEALSGGSGIIVDGSNASILWDETNDVFDINKGLTALGNVGIGTTNPQQDLHISSSEAVIRLEDAAGYTDIKSLNNSGINIDCDGGNTDPDTEFRVSIDGSQKFVIDTSGNVGINVDSPQGTLHIADPDANTDSELLIGNSGTSSGGNLLGSIWFGSIESSGSRAAGIKSTADQDFNANDTPADLSFWITNDNTTGATQKMVIDSSGNVGIGTSSPSHLLEISGTTPTFRIDNTGGVNNYLDINYGSKNTNDISFTSRRGGSPSGFVFGTEPGGSYSALMKITSGGTVAIGTASPNAVKLHVGDTAHNDLISGTQILATGSSAGAIGIGLANGNGTGVCNLLFGSTSDGNDGEISYNLNDKTMNFYTGGNTHAMTIEDDQTVCVNRTSKFGAAGTASMIVIQGSQATMRVGAANSNDFPLLAFYNGGLGNIGNIHTNGTTGVTYDTASDYRMKENVNYDWNGLSIINQLRPAKYNWIADDMDGIEEGFIAHEVQEILPYVVSGEKDAMEPAILYEEDDREVIAGTANVGEIKEEEKIKPQSMDYGRITPILVKAIQEQQTIIEDLKARIETLENA